ncbi:phosphoadenosine phosphosulfate reductase family protein (plasmid) [Deinococcus sp. KNUC1210]|uniref:phosphoadenosine phosphosulfate reductase domain-containing protein n=1 Tax=Deinococcus sp. KNUC1210 TaxID=2917691 RepID=UPI001EF05E0D|nr:phosphoadenosine phosphosulfate reductase family protein [Deinococcus sp. KNUC1210]ULH17422.1 phosphoadenosine phosphosulfate reductase family protein [Deinococcus sp. KNUC1210]
MGASQLSLWQTERQGLLDALELTAMSLREYGERHRHWVVAYSGGKDSTATVTALDWLIAQGRVPAPESLTILYADTRMELPPLQASAMQVLARLEARGATVKTVLPPLDKRMLVYILGRGVPPPKNRFRWCTRQLKIDPMVETQQALIQQHGEILLLTGVRVGESAARDQRIALSCGKDGAECGQGWYQAQEFPGLNKLAPLLHWRVCNVWDWLTGQEHGLAHGYPTSMLAEAYGGDEAAEINARTGCMACPLASRDVALEAIVELPQWAHFKAVLRLRALWEELRAPHFRLRKPDGRMGPLTFEARMYGLRYVLAIQDEVNALAAALGLPGLDILNIEEHARILELIDAQQWPNGWDGTERRSDDQYFRDANAGSDWMYADVELHDGLGGLA